MIWLSRINPKSELSIVIRGLCASGHFSQVAIGRDVVARVIKIIAIDTSMLQLEQRLIADPARQVAQPDGYTRVAPTCWR